MFKQIATIVNLRRYARAKGWKKARYVGRYCINLIRNAGGLKMNIVYQSKDGAKQTFDLPMTAIDIIIKIAKEEGFNTNYNPTSWRLIDWRKKN